MKMLSLFTVVVVALSFVDANAQLSDGANAAIAEVVATAKNESQEKTLEAVKEACTKFPEAAADIVSAVIVAIGGEEADPDYVGKIVLTAVKAASKFSDDIIAAALKKAPHAIAQINVSATGGGLPNPLDQNGGQPRSNNPTIPAS